MQEFKELTIGRTPNGFLPHLPLNGRWLEILGFTAGKSVRATFDHSCLTLSISHHHSDLLVESRIVRHRPRTTLNINAFYLKKYGFLIGDRVGLILNQGMIQITKINTFTTETVA